MVKIKKHCLQVYAFFCLSGIAFSQENEKTWIRDEIKTSIILHLEAIKIIDSLSQNVWPEWIVTDRICYFIGAPDNNAVFINPLFDLPKDFIPYTELNSSEKIVIREKSAMEHPTGSTTIEIDGIIYPASSLMPFSIDTLLYAYFNSELEKITNNKRIITDINRCIRTPEFYIFPIVHETFHFYQDKKEIRPIYCANEPSFYSRPRIFAFSYMEGMLLQRALNADSEKQMTDIVNQFIAVRCRKGKELPVWQRKFERVDEFVEGTAQYVTYKFSVLLQEMNYKSQTRDENEESILDFTQENKSRMFDSLFFIASIKNKESIESKQYYYGQAQAILLDRLCGETWKTEIMETGVYLIDLLIRYSNYDKKQYKTYLEKAIRYYRFKDLLKYIKNTESNERIVIDYY